MNELLDAALDELTPKQRYVVELSWGLRGEAFSFYEIAEAMGISQKGVRNIYGRAMDSLRGYLVGPLGERK